MTRRTLIALAAAAPVALAACGSDSGGADDADGSLPPVTEAAGSDGSDGSSDGEPSSSAPPAEGSLPAADADVVLSLTIGGGFMMRELAFQNAPTLIVTGDGRAITLAAVPAVFPGPLVVPHVEQSITPEGVQALITAADEAGLLADLEFDENSNIADAPTTTLEITTTAGTFVHEAYALGMEGGGPLVGEGAPAADANAALQSFVDSLSDLEALVGAENLGPETEYEPTGYQIVALDIEEQFEPGFEPTIVDWPVADVSIADLATTGECAVADADDVGDVLDDATLLTRFEEDGEAFLVLARPDYPGQSC